MISGVILFTVVSLIFSMKGLMRLVAGEHELSLKEQTIGFLFGRYMGGVAGITFFLWLFRPINPTLFSIGAGAGYMILTLYLLIKAARILIQEEFKS